MERITRASISVLVHRLQEWGCDICCYSSNGTLKIESKDWTRTYAIGLTTREAYFWLRGYSFRKIQEKQKLEDQV